MRAIALLSCLVGCAAASHAGIAAEPSRIEFLNSPQAKATHLPFSEAVRVGNMLYLSGEIGRVPNTTQIVAGGLKAEARQALENIKARLESFGYSMADVVKCTVMLADMAEWPAFNEVYRAYFTEHLPARSAFGVNGLAFGARVEVECMAAR